MSTRRRAAVVVLCVCSALPAASRAQISCVTDVTESGQIDAYLPGLTQYMPGEPLHVEVEPDSDPIQGNPLTGDKVKDGLEKAAADWNGTCSETYVPKLEIDAGTTREGGVAVGIKYMANTPATQQGDNITLAEFDSVSGVMTVYGQCLNGKGELFSAICQKRGDNYYIDWSADWAVAFLTHELGHALGVGHDRSDGECSGFNGLMGKPVNYKGSLKPEYCAFANHQNCDDSNTASCPDDPRVPDDPIGQLPDHCERIRILCVPSDPTGGTPVLWWHTSGSSFRCTAVYSTTESAFGTTITITRGCYWITGEDPDGKAAADGGSTLPPAETVTGPTMKVLKPSPAQPVSGVTEVTGWAAQADEGVAQVAFWLDGQPVNLANFQYGTEQAGICADVADPNCPYVGFRGDLNTTGLNDGVHTLEVVSAEARALDPGPGYRLHTFTVDNTDPSASITAPGAGATVSGVVPVTASASDANGVSVVWFSVDGVSQARDHSAPYEFDWDTALWSNGTHVVEAEAWDRSGNSHSSEVVVTVTNDFETPQVALLQPSAGQLVSGSVSVAASAVDNQGVSSVEVYLDGSLVGTDATAPYSITWSSASVADGPHTLTARAFDATGNVGLSDPLQVTVDNTTPQVYVDSPTHLQSVQGSSVKISGWAIDGSGIASRAFKLDGLALPVTGLVSTVNRQGVCDMYSSVGDPACPSVGWRGYFDSTAFSNGGHTLSVTVTDAAGNAATFQRQLVIDNPPVTLTFNPVADATAWQVTPTFNDGTSSTLTVRSPNDGYGAYSFLKFQVSGVQAPVSSARLRVRARDAMVDLWLYWLVSSSWSETGLTWNNFPGPGGELGHLDNLTAGGWYSFDVSGYVTGDGTYSLGFGNSGSVYARLWSRESLYEPVLEISYDP